MVPESWCWSRLALPSRTPELRCGSVRGAHGCASAQSPGVSLGDCPGECRHCPLAMTHSPLRLALLVVLQVGGGHPEDGLSSNPSLLHNHVTLPSQPSSLPDLSRQQDTYSGKALQGCRVGLTCAGGSPAGECGESPMGLGSRPVQQQPGRRWMSLQGWCFLAAFTEQFLLGAFSRGFTESQNGLAWKGP